MSRDTGTVSTTGAKFIAPMKGSPVYGYTTMRTMPDGRALSTTTQISANHLDPPGELSVNLMNQLRCQPSESRGHPLQADVHNNKQAAENKQFTLLESDLANLDQEETLTQSAIISQTPNTCPKRTRLPSGSHLLDHDGKEQAPSSRYHNNNSQDCISNSKNSPKRIMPTKLCRVPAQHVESDARLTDADVKPEARVTDAVIPEESPLAEPPSKKVVIADPPTQSQPVKLLPKRPLRPRKIGSALLEPPKTPNQPLTMLISSLDSKSNPRVQLRLKPLLQPLKSWSQPLSPLQRPQNW
ncbi:hypothetical protein Pst134EA_032861 [Puccinia striiformis f. sp. tritici]|uniref:uncharacterized protein n=1 Tax=Puccinia striiformis f. sp. tritici TaxID=168172 RepID=UPI002007E950|nr:uncharacterized protein Pst134EA_032861 [Puccinia striiformis f. sp. tritici]KAH9441562.1 hypothetical protein Pst134EA_032861 [Puccinia striiformis f. sp. tritici]